MAALATRSRPAQLAASVVLCLATASTAADDPRSETIRRAASCIIAGDRGASISLAQAIPGSGEESAAWARLDALIVRCFARAPLADTPEARSLLAGQVAERLYLSTTTSFHSQVRSIATTTAGAITLPQALSHRTQDWPAEAAVAECIAASMPNEVDRLLRTRAGSRPEASAIQPITAGLSACLNRGQQLTMTRPGLRAALARAFYRYINPMLPPGLQR
jgi:hypothetical protein